MQCTATSKASKERCRRYAMKGRNTCWMHGGSTPRGFALPQTKHGRYSKDLPTRMAATYQASLSDPDLLALRSEIALIDARIEDLLKRVDTGESSRLWGLLRETHTAMLDARATRDNELMALKLNQLGDLIGAGLDDYAAWGDLQRTIEQRRKLVESERKRLMDMQAVITSEQAMVLMAAVLDSIRRNVSDRPTLAAIQADLSALVAIESAGRRGGPPRA